jgi:hypothetical protein
MGGVGYIAMRKSVLDPVEWMDYQSLYTTHESAISASRIFDDENPDWARINPVTRIARVIIREEA